MKVTVCLVAAFLQGLCMVTFPASSFIFKSQAYNGLSDQQYGIAFLPQILMAVVSTFAMRILFVFFGRRTILFSGFFLNVCCLVALMMTRTTLGDAKASLYWILLANGFLGLGFGCLVSVLNVAMVEIFPEQTDASLTGLHGILGLGAGLSPLLINFLHAHDFWIGAPALFAGAFLILGVAVQISGAAKDHTELGRSRLEEKVHIVPKTVVPFGAFVFLFAILVYGIIEAMMGNWTVTYFYINKNLSSSDATLALGLFWIFLTVGRLLVTGLSVKVEAALIYRVTPCVMVVGLIALVILKTTPLLFLAPIIIGLGCSAFFPLSLSLAIRRYGQWDEILSTWGLAALMMGVGCGSSLVGLLNHGQILSLHQSFMMAIFFALFLFGVSVVLTRNKATCR